MRRILVMLKYAMDAIQVQQSGQEKFNQYLTLFAWHP
jgi:hypothetical protein